MKTPAHTTSETRGPVPKPGLLQIKPYKPGDATVDGVADPVKLSSNENPLGTSAAAREAYVRAAQDMHFYPESTALRVREALAAKYGLEVDRILCGQGSDELLHLFGGAFLEPGDEVLQGQYGFVSYPLVALKNRATPVLAPERDFTIDVDAMLALVTPKTRIVFLANPNNPTGTMIPYRDVKRLHAALPEDVLLVLDAAYAEYVDDTAYEPGLELARSAPNVVMTRTFSKIHGLAGVRLGWAYGPKDVIEAAGRVRGPFNVSIPAQEAGIAALGDDEFAERSRTHNRIWRAWLTEEIGRLGLKVTPSAGNFVMLHFRDADQRRAADSYLRSQGLILRPLEPHALMQQLRLSVGLEDDNRRVAAALRDFLAAS